MATIHKSDHSLDWGVFVEIVDVEYLVADAKK